MTKQFVIRTFLLLVLLATNAGARAECPGNGAGDPNCAGKGNPLNVITGNKFQRETDMPALPGQLGLELVRYYNSNTGGLRNRNGIIGRGWRLSYEMTLAVVGDTIQVIEADGGRLVFSRDPLQPSLCSNADPANGEIDIRQAGGRDEYIWRKPDGRRLSFNAEGHLVQILAPSGEFVALQHDSRGWLVKVTDPQGRSLRLNYLDSKQGNDGRRFRGVQSVDTPVGRYTYAYGNPAPVGADAEGRAAVIANLAQVAVPDGSRRIYHYEDGRFPTLLTGISTAEQGAAQPVRYATFAYDHNGKAVLSTHADKSGYVALDTSIGGQTVLTNSFGQKTTYRYGLIGGEFRIREVTGAGCALCGATNVRYGRDAQGRVTSVTYLGRDGAPVRAEMTRFDYFGRPVELSVAEYTGGRMGPARVVMTVAYARGTAAKPILIVRPSVVDGAEWRVALRYNDAGQLAEQTETGWTPGQAGQQPTLLRRTTVYQYQRINGRSVLTAVDGPLPNGPAGTPADSDITQLRWNATATQVQEVVSPGGFSHRLGYDQAGRPVSVTDETGRRREVAFDAQGRAVRMSGDGQVQQIKYDALGNVIERGTGEGEAYRADMRYGYDAAGRAVWAASALGILARAGYDSENRLLSTALMSAHMVREESYQYDEFGRPVRATAPAGSREFAWNPQDRLIGERDALGRSTSLHYDVQGRLARYVPPAASGEISFERNVRGEAVAVMAGKSKPTRYLRNDFGQTIAVASPDSGLSQYQYDAAGRLLKACEADGACAAYSYDGASRVTRRVITDSAGAASETRWRYTGRQLAAVESATQSEFYEYAAAGQISRRTVVQHLPAGGSISSETSYGYDSSGRLSTISLADGSLLVYKRNGQGQVVAVERERIRTAWLRWLLPAQTIVSGLERDIVGLSRIRFGNGVEGFFQRSRSGALARIVYRRPQPPLKSAGLQLPGIGTAHAAEAAPASGPALLERSYLWDRQGNLVRQGAGSRAAHYAYDARDRLIAAVSKVDGQPAGKFDALYYFDGIGNRMLAMEQGRTQGTRYEAGSSRPTGANPAGALAQPAAMPQREYVWQAGGLLAEVRHQGELLAAYRYSHRGERMEKRTPQGTSRFFYEDRQLVAETNGQGRMVRQYINLGGSPFAMIEYAAAVQLAAPRGKLSQALSDLGTALGEWFRPAAKIVFLHANHLGAIELATGSAGQVIWAAEYHAFGAVGNLRGERGFGMPLRLPGQYADAETGLYYNDHRYYDPRSGRYISPDPLGLRGGVNSYVYADGNPLKYVDPTGLILFAFDGTGNSANPQENESHSNVYKFYTAYNQTDKFYITGIGTTDENMSVKGNILNGAGFKERLDLGFTFLDKYIRKSGVSGESLTIDVIGFSRGAAEARAWLNQLQSRLSNGAYKVDKLYRCIVFNFAGLWDTVPHLGLLNGEESKYNFTLPEELGFAAHANALNEYRGEPADFDFHSILLNPTDAPKKRIERNFLGAHSDIGGGYGKGDLSDVALMWMIEQAGLHGVPVDMQKVSDEGWNEVTEPYLHDSSSNLTQGAPAGGPEPWGLDRDVIYGDGTKVLQRNKQDTGVMTHADTLKMITYLANPNDYDRISATVDMKAYMQWLNEHHYFIAKGSK